MNSPGSFVTATGANVDDPFQKKGATRACVYIIRKKFVQGNGKMTGCNVA